MSWLYSRVLVAEYLGENSLDGEQSAPLSGKPTPQAYCAPGKMTDFSRLSRFGMTFKPLTENLGEELLTLYREAFHVPTLVPQEKEQELTEKPLECGEKWRGSFTKYDQDLSLWKTHQCSLVGDLEEFLETWPQWGLMRDGECWEQKTLEQTIRGTEYGLKEKQECLIVKNVDGNLKLGVLQDLDALNVEQHNQKLLKWPTPRSCSAMAATITPESAWNEKRNPNLETIVGQRLWPTPDANCGMRGTQELWTPKRKSGHQAQYSINQAVRDSFATPTARMWKDNGTSPAELNRNSETLAVQAGGNLNPTWVEWLMGWPLGWTDLKPLATDKSHCAPQPLGDS